MTITPHHPNVLRSLLPAAALIMGFALACGDDSESGFLGRTDDPSGSSYYAGPMATPPDVEQSESSPPSSGPSEAPPSPASPPDAALTVSIGSFNVKEFFDVTCDSRCCGDSCPRRGFEQQPTESEFEAKTNRVANAVVNLDTDILLLQEVENQSCVDALQATLGEKQYPVAVMGETGELLDVVTLARDTLIEHRVHRDQELILPDGRQSRFVREFLEVHLERDGRRIIVFNAHFKSKNNDDPALRLAEAERALAIMEARTREFPEALIVLGGDLNDEPGSQTIAVFDENVAFNRVTTELAPGLGTYYGFTGSNQPTVLDHIIGIDTETAFFVPGSTQVLRNGENAGLFGSDHAGLRATFGFAP